MDGDLDQLIARLSKDESLSKNVRFFVGYSGWTEGQLEAEIRDDAWMVSKINPKEVFKLCEDSSKMWKKYLQQLGEKYRVWSTYPLIPELN